MRRHELSDEEWAIIPPLLLNRPRGVPRVDDRRVLNGILRRFRTGAPWRDIPERYGRRTTLYNRFVRWQAAWVWDRYSRRRIKGVRRRHRGDRLVHHVACTSTALPSIGGPRRRR
jgi:transposase